MSKVRNKSKGPKFKSSRSLKSAIWASGKNTYSRRESRPGQHGSKMATKTAYGTQLETKQRLKVHYGMLEKQFKNAFLLASQKKGVKTEIFAQMLESRLMTLCYRSNFAASIYHARQLVSHKHVLVNGKPVNIPSYIVKPGDVVSCVEKPASRKLVSDSLASREKSSRAPEYLEVDSHKITFTYKFLPQSSQIPYPFQPELLVIKTFYSK